METKLPTVFWHNVVKCAFLLCCLCQVADSKDPQPQFWKMRSRTKSIPFQNKGSFFRLYPQSKTYRDAVKFCEDSNGRIARYRDLREQGKWLDTIVSSNLTKTQLLWLNHTTDQGTDSLEDCLKTMEQGSRQICHESYSFICEEARTTSRCLENLPFARIFEDSERSVNYQIFLSKVTHDEARKNCSGSGRKLADWNTSKNAVKHFLGSNCHGPVLNEKIWFSDNTDCVASLNTNLDSTQEEDCNQTHIFVCEKEIFDIRACLQDKQSMIKSVSNDFSIHLSKKTYTEADAFCRERNGTLAYWKDANKWLVTQIKQQCPGVADEKIWTYGVLWYSSCRAVDINYPNQRFPIECHSKNAFICNDDPQPLFWATKNGMRGIPFQHQGRSFRLYHQKKTHNEAVKFCKDLKGQIAQVFNLPSQREWLQKVPSMNGTKNQLLWVDRDTDLGIKCFAALSNDVKHGSYTDCRKSYPFICELE